MAKTEIPVKPTQEPPHTLSASTHCMTKTQPDNGIQVTFLIEPEAAKRLMKKAGTMPLARYLWENILKQAIDTHVF